MKHFQIDRYKMFVCVAVLLVFSGCRGQHKTHPVEGQVRFTDGSTPMFGDIEFYNAEHQINARGKINRDGTFTVGTYKDNDGAVEGEHKIVIIQNTGSVLEDQFKVKINHNHGGLVDRAYIDYRTSGLSCTVKPGINQFELVVKRSSDQSGD